MWAEAGEEHIHVHSATKSRDSTIWVRAAGDILTGGGRQPRRGVQTSQAPHGSKHPAAVASSVCSCSGSGRDEFHRDSEGSKSTSFSHPHTTPAFFYENTTSSARSSAVSPRWNTGSIPPPPPPLPLSAQFTALSLYFCLSLTLTHVSTSLLSPSLSLCFSAVSQCCPAKDAEHVFRGGGWDC
ncbi:unnamed protein product [Pleuronectes platessa]|uniref:Uncharacterized protein n=1 Tax=Pleuronectes platessa TaxID=8262 RepID=A0A9N7VH80_PLEPL|nr:unnamed protein product [Pleuronectes platessa]